MGKGCRKIDFEFQTLKAQKYVRARIREKSKQFPYTGGYLWILKRRDK